MEYNYIVDNTDLESCVNQMNELPAIAVDLEFDKNRYAYGFNLCLVQIFTGTNCFLIDPLSPQIDIDKLFPVFENHNIQKVVFAFGEDLRLLHSLACFPKNIFDIAIAAKLLNHPPGSLAALLEQVLEIKVSKASQKSNWLKRPLSEVQLDYAAQDVVYLPALKIAIEKEAIAKHKMDWIKDENAVFDQLSYAGVENNNFIKKKEQKGLSEFEWYVYKQLMTFREKVAEKTGRPSYQVYNKDLIRELALNPEKIKAWGNRNGDFKAFRFNGFNKYLKQIIEEAQNMGLSKTEPAKKPLNKEEALLKRKQRSKEEELKNRYFKPIQKEIIEEHGEHAATLILGNRVIAMILAGETGQLKPYQLQLIKENAKKLKLDMALFFN